MKFAPRFALAALAGALTLTGLAATPAAARTSVSIEYRDRDYRGDYRDYRDYRRDDRREWRRDRWDRRDRYDRRGYYSYRGRNCWTEWRYDRRHHERYAVRYCR